MKSQLSFTFFLCLLILFTTFHISYSSAPKLINTTCQTISVNDPNINYKFCTTSLQSAPDSHCARLRHLGMISLRLIRYNATNTRCHIKHLLANNDYRALDPFFRQCLVDCLNLYSDAVVTLRDAMRDYGLKRYEDANIGASGAMDGFTTCEDGFKDKDGMVSPLTKRNHDAFELSAIALSIINMFH